MQASVRQQIHALTEARQSPCRARQGRQEGKRELRELARSLKRLGYIDRNVDVDALGFRELCDVVSAVEPRSLVGKVLLGLVGAFAILAGTSHLRHPYGPATKLPVSGIVPQQSMPALQTTQGTLDGVPLAKLTLPRITRFLQTLPHGVVEGECKRCVDQYGEMARSADAHVRRVAAMNPGHTAAKDPLGIAPGTHIFYTGAFKVRPLTHHGIYLGDGLIVDVGSIPEACRGPGRTSVAKVMSSAPFKAQGIGLTNFAEFAGRGAHVYQMRYTRALPAADVLARAVAAIGPNKYSLLHDNCEHLATELATGVRASHQVDEAKRAARVGASVAGIPAAATRFVRWMQRFWTDVAGAPASSAMTFHTAMEAMAASSPAASTFRSARSRASRSSKYISS